MILLAQKRFVTISEVGVRVVWKARRPALDSMQLHPMMDCEIRTADMVGNLLDRPLSVVVPLIELGLGYLILEPRGRDVMLFKPCFHSCPGAIQIRGYLFLSAIVVFVEVNERFPFTVELFVRREIRAQWTLRLGLGTTKLVESRL
ncbi:hypothetical protein [Halomarina oriensis]|uniref:hypothetical protein n=1 Tax=Halomarina oriensis TaxID=671145 RepID=UPI001E3ED64B|nr:hypothetical protein [Halomarina oriensis]